MDEIDWLRALLLGGSAGTVAAGISGVGTRRGWPKWLTFLAIAAAIVAVVAIVNLFWPRGT
jgi:hypothetical protein